jgi:hypothetical protein
LPICVWSNDFFWLWDDAGTWLATGTWPRSRRRSSTWRSWSLCEFWHCLLIPWKLFTLGMLCCFS